MKDDAVAPVIAVMLILAIIVTFLSAWNALYIPSMKAQSEMSHLKDVETGMLRFSSDIDAAASLKRPMKMSEQIPLGGGDITLNPVKSGGLLQVTREKNWYMRAYIENVSGENTQNRLYLVNYSYIPVQNFWQDQGYTWAFGYVNVTKGELHTPLQFYTAADVTYNITESLVGIEAIPSSENPGDCAVITLHMVNMTPNAFHPVASGNGMGTLELVGMQRTETVRNATKLAVSVNLSAPQGFQNTLWQHVKVSVNDLTRFANVGVPVIDDTNKEIRVDFATISNVTVVREITEISVGAY